MTSELEVELGGPDVSLVSGLEDIGGPRLHDVIGALCEGRKVVGWEQFCIYIGSQGHVQQVSSHSTLDMCVYTSEMCSESNMASVCRVSDISAIKFSQNIENTIFSC